MGAIIKAVFGLFTGKFKMWAWLGLAAVLVAGAGFASYVIIQGLKKDREIAEMQRDKFKEQVEQRDRAIKQMEVDREDFLDRTNRIMGDFSNMQKNMARNATRRQNDYSGMVTPNAQNGAPLEEVRTRTNTGMNNLFRELEELSREGIDEQK